MHPEITRPSQPHADDLPGFMGLFGDHESMRRIYAIIRRVGPSDAPVLITGESGTGKELVARALHELSARAARAFVPVHCGAIPEDLLESELFGHVRGAFTGAIAARTGRFQLAHHGTVFLDEIGEMSAALPGEAAARSRGRQLRSGRCGLEPAYRRPGDRGDPPRPARGHSGRHLPRRSALPPRRGPHPPPGAARASRGHPADRAALPSPARRPAKAVRRSSCPRRPPRR